jgi:hypothetical protein
MGRYRKIDPRIWNDERFRAFSDDGKLAFLFVLTHPSMTALGAMRATIEGLAAEMRWPPRRFSDAISEARSQAMLDVDERALFVGVRNFLRYNEPEGPNSVAKAWVEALDLIPECPAKTALISRCRAYLDARSKKFRDALPDAIWDAFPAAIREASPIQEPEPEPEPEQEQEQEQDASRRAHARAGGGHDDLEDFRGKLAAQLGLPRIRIGKNPGRVVSSFRRWLDIGLEEDLLAECVRIAREKGITPGHLSWWAGWIDTVSDQELERLVLQRRSYASHPAPVEP